MKLYVDPSNEKYVKWAKSMLAKLTAMRKSLNLSKITRAYVPETGVLVHIMSSEWDDFIRITGAQAYGFSTFFKPDFSVIANAQVNKQGKVLKPARNRFGFLSNFAPIKVAFRTDGLRGSEVDAPTEEGAEVLESVDITGQNMGQGIHITEDTITLSMLHNSDGSDLGDLQLTALKYDKTIEEPPRWSETTVDAVPASVVAATTGLSSFHSMSFNNVRYDYNFPSPFPGEAGGPILFSTFANVSLAPLATQDHHAMGYVTRSYITEMTAGSVFTDYTDHEDPDENDEFVGVPGAYACIVDFTGQTDVWFVRRNMDTLETEIVHSYSLEWTGDYTLIHKIASGQTGAYISGSRVLTATINTNVDSNVIYGGGETIVISPLGGASTPSFVATPDMDTEDHYIVKTKVIRNGERVTDSGDALNGALEYLPETGIGGPPPSALFMDVKVGDITRDVQIDYLRNGVSMLTKFYEDLLVFPSVNQSLSRSAREGIFSFYITPISEDRVAVVDTPAGLTEFADPGDTVQFVCGVFKGGDSRIQGWIGDSFDYIKDEGIVLSTPVSSSLSIFGLDERVEGTFYMVDNFISTSSIYSIKEVNGVWSLTTSDHSVQDTWDFDGNELVKFGDSITPYSSFTALEDQINAK